jgi:hypothetical protein
LPEEPHPWRLIINALIEVALAALSGEWTRYGKRAFGDRLGAETAASQRLWQPRAS